MTTITGNKTVDGIISTVEAAAPLIAGALNIVSPGVGSLLTGILSSIPSIVSAVENDIEAFNGGVLTEQELQTKWSAMQVNFRQAVSAWNAIPDSAT